MRPFPLNRIVLSLLAAIALTGGVAIAAHAQETPGNKEGQASKDGQDTKDNKDDLLAGHQFRIGVGLSPIVNEKNHYSDLAAAGGASEFVKADFTFDRAKHQENLASAYFAHGKYTLDGETTSLSLGGATIEHRWRFFGHGVGYVGSGGGLLTSGLSSPGLKVGVTLGFGADLGHIYIEERSLAPWSGNRAIAALFIGTRF